MSPGSPVPSVWDDLEGEEAEEEEVVTGGPRYDADGGVQDGYTG
jgi:hypothetical protein